MRLPPYFDLVAELWFRPPRPMTTSRMTSRHRTAPVYYTEFNEY